MGDGQLHIEALELEDAVEKAVDMVQDLDIIDMGLDPLEEEGKDEEVKEEFPFPDGDPYMGEDCPFYVLDTDIHDP